MREIIDFHSHVLPEIDDGSKNADMSMAMLREMEKQGVTLCVATPHFYPYRRSVSSFLERRARATNVLKDKVTGHIPKLLLGAEVAFCTDLLGLSEDELNSLCIEGTRLLLLEMPFDQWTGYEVEALSHFCLEREYQVILAHLERFIPLQRDMTALEHLLQLPLLVQLNAECLTSVFHRRRYIEMFRNGTAHLLGSDCHDMSSRRPNLQAGRTVIEKKLGRDTLLALDDFGATLLSQTTSVAGGYYEP